MRPTSDQVLTVVNTFKKVAMAKRSWLGKIIGKKDIPNMVDMAKGNEDTPCCHGAWYAKANGIEPHPIESFFVQGANKMVKDLGIPVSMGFSGVEALIIWADSNPILWGNSNGARVFSANGRMAFAGKNRPRGACTVQDFVDHWTEVYKRIKALEEKEATITSQLQYLDITSELADISVQDEVSDVVVKEEMVEA